MELSARELRDLVLAWLALGVAFTLFFEGPGVLRRPRAALGPFALVLGTVGVGFLLHELAHKVVAVRFGQVAAFRADYGMLFVAIMGGFIGFIFAAPGAVHHRGRITPREHGLIAAAGPLTNLGLAALFALVWPLSPAVGALGVGINLLLAGFNMLPVGGLDGRTVLTWSRAVYAVIALPSIGLAAFALVRGIGV
ncbi:MAG: metalloprotease [Halobacteriaceae archaeon]